ncbi:alpha-1,3-arabinosyltransferase XAT3-like [Primulina huaijiensis]|uniref:alpha-1,3-arabinosyltransferase XAT3-like n=1 Tax=Primulina huaijiensis TaxID=1492673 RepID=UPI003CC75259
MGKRRHRFALYPLIFLPILLIIYIDLHAGHLNLNTWIQSEYAFHTRRIIGINITAEDDHQESFKVPLSRLVRGEEGRNLETKGFACHSSDFSLLCVASQPVRIDTRSSNITVHIPSDLAVQETNIRPYGRQENNFLQHIKPVNILHGNHSPVPECEVSHIVPALIFSSAYIGNTFHEFSDLIIPLFLTSNHLKSRVLIILDDYNSSFVDKFRPILSRLSAYEVMNPAENRSIHCFTGSIIGLTYHDVLTLDPKKVPGDYTMTDFKLFLRETFNLENAHISQIRSPTLLLLSRTKTRRFLNEDEMVAMIKEMGFRVIIGRDAMVANMTTFSRIVNSCSVLVGVHGAGLTNELFLPAGGVMVQLELLGLEFASSYSFGNPAPAMGVHYVPYSMEPEESSLVELYGRHHAVIVNSSSVYEKGYQEVQKVYLDQPNVRVNIARFRESSLVQALELVTDSQSQHIVGGQKVTPISN